MSILERLRYYPRRIFALQLLQLSILLSLPVAVHARSVMKVSEGVTLDSAIDHGLRFETKEIVEINVRKLNFSEFDLCQVDSILIQTFDKRRHVQLSANLESKEGWYEFSVHEDHKDNWRLAVHCKFGTGAFGIYFISPTRSLLPPG